MELVGNFKNGHREWQPTGEPELVDVHDFPGDAVGKHRRFLAAIGEGLADVNGGRVLTTKVRRGVPPALE